MIELAVRYVCRRCNREVGTIQRNTDYFNDESIIWTLRTVTGPQPAPDPNDIDVPAVLIKSNGRGGWVHQNRRYRDIRRSVADISFVDVGIGSEGRPGRKSQAFVAGLEPHCLRCASLERITGAQANISLRNALRAEETVVERLGHASPSAVL